MFFEIIIFAALLFLSALLKPKPKDTSKPASLGDFTFPTATEGRPVLVFWGTVKLSGPNVIWYGDLQQVPITQKQKTGLFSSTTTTIGYKYYLGVQMALARGGNVPVGKLLRIWVGDDVAWTGSVTNDGDTLTIDNANFFGGDSLGQGGLQCTVRFHSGSYTQGVNSYLTAFQNIGGATSAYRGTSYVVIEAGYIGNSTSIAAWAFEAQRIPNGLGLATATVNTYDANPMNVIYELLTNTEWGLGRPAGDIDVTDFTAAALTLATEGNGFSFVLDNPVTAESVIEQLEQQIDGLLYIDRTTGKFRMNLARGGYTLSTKRAINAGNIISINTFSRGSWDDTTNNILVQFNNRALDYQETFAGAQDMANMRLQGNKVVSVNQAYAGVKDAALANNIATRNLRTLAYPMATAEVVCDRSVYDQNMGDVVRWTDPDLGFTDLPMRIKKIDLGELVDGKITLSLVQDIFVYDLAVFAAPGATTWTSPPATVFDVATADRVIFEAPKAFCDRDSVQPGLLNRVWCGARWQHDASVDILLEASAGGVYTPVGQVSGFLVAGTIANNMDASGTQGAISITVNPTLDTKQQLLANTEGGVTQADCGQRLANICVIGNEFFVFKTATPSGSNVVLAGGYRGVLDTAPAAHSAGDRLSVLYPGNITDTAFTPGVTEGIKLLPRGRLASLAESSATATNVTMSHRAQRPYPPANETINGVIWATTTNLDTSAGGGPSGGLDDYGIAIGFTRRDYRTGDEAAAVVDETTLPTDFPTANTTQYQVELRNDPAGSNTLLFTTAFNAGTTPIKLSRSLILRNTAGVIPSHLRATVKTQHVDSGTTFSSTQNLVWDFAVTASILTGTFNFGVLSSGGSSSGFTAPSTGTYTLALGTALATGAVQVSINGGAFTPVVVATTTSGTFVANNGDTIVVRHTQGGTVPTQTICLLSLSGTLLAYAIFTY